MASERDWFLEVLEILIQHTGLYDFQLTKIFLSKPWQCISSEWMTYLNGLNIDDLNNFPYNLHKDLNMPPSLQKFLQLVVNIPLKRECPAWVVSNAASLSLSERRGMNPKKCHEVERLCHVVHTMCQQHSCSQIIDVGSGLGYLGQVLSQRHGYHVCGLESEGTRAHGADNWIKKKDADSNLLKTVTFFLEDKQQCYTDFSHLVSTIRAKTGESQAQDKISQTQEIGTKPDSPHKSCISHEQQSNNTNCDTRDGTVSVACSNCLKEEPHIPSSLSRDDNDICDDSLLSTTTDVKPTVSAISNTDLNISCVEEAVIKPDTQDRLQPDGFMDLPPQVVSTGGICMTGLHCCGDLTPTMLKFFARCPEVSCLVCLGCCYHNMTQSDTGGFNMFPLSSTLKKHMSSIKSKSGGNVISAYALRLAAQETRSRWRSQSAADHQYHTNNVAFRGLLELYCQQEGISVSKEKRKVARRKDYTDLETYVSAVVSRIKLDKPLDYVQMKMKMLYNEHKEYIKYIEPLTCLQVLLQSVLESLVIVDRLTYLHEQGLHAEALPVFDEQISPRNIAIVAWK